MSQWNVTVIRSDRKTLSLQVRYNPVPKMRTINGTPHTNPSILSNTALIFSMITTLLSLEKTAIRVLKIAKTKKPIIIIDFRRGHKYYYICSVLFA